jgi:hypothetical protein
MKKGQDPEIGITELEDLCVTLENMGLLHYQESLCDLHIE